MNFVKPDRKTIDRMTPESIEALLGTLKTRRRDLVAPISAEIEYYDKLLQSKLEEREKANQTKLGGGAGNA